MQSILIAGSGRIGNAIAQLFSHYPQLYQITLVDQVLSPPPSFSSKSNLRYVPIDVQNQTQAAELIRNNQFHAIISCLPYFANIGMAKLAKLHNLHYFDVTEDVVTANAIMELANDSQTAFVPQCGVAPGFINIVANELMQHFSQLEIVKLRCGALPSQSSHALQYALTWSIEGLINEYANLCPAIISGEVVNLYPLADLEQVYIDGLTYEAFNTSGGLGLLLQNYVGKVHTLNYKTLRYPGHCSKMAFLMQDLKLSEDRHTLKKILQNILPTTRQDVVILYVSVQGYQAGQLMQESYVNKFYPTTVEGQVYSAIQMATASGLCSVVDIVLHSPEKYCGLVYPSQFTLREILDNRFGRYLQ